MITLLICVSILPEKNLDYGFVVASLVAGVFSWIFGNKWNGQDARVVVDEKTGQRIILKSNHSLFWIKMQYWGVIFGIIGIVILAQNSIWASILLGVILISLIVLRFANFGRNSLNVSKVNSVEAEREAAIEKQKEIEAERLKRRKEKEDPSRFMPK
ncbi:MAG: hypothetical protein ACEPOZ_09700 [Marinifilaceae bacterium]